MSGGGGVARGLASRLRLKRRGLFDFASWRISRQGIGFSPEIETQQILARMNFLLGRQGIGFSPEIETQQSPIPYGGFI